MPKAPAVLAALAIATLIAIPAALAAGHGRGEIAGRVTDVSGAPLRGICATAVTPTDVAFPVHTNARGKYAVSVPAGTYKLYFAGCGQSPNYSPQWYPDKPSQSTARSLSVHSGQMVGGIDARMQPAGVITGRVLKSSGRSPGPFFGVDALRKGHSDAVPMFLASTFHVASDGSYTIVGLASGSYLVEFPSGGAGPLYALAWYPDEPDPGHAQWIHVIAGQTTSIGLDVLERAGAIKGHIRDRHSHPVSGAIVTAGIPEPDGSVYLGNSTTVGRDGSYTLGGLAPGEWTVSVKLGHPRPVARRPALVKPRATTRLDFSLRRASR